MGRAYHEYSEKGLLLITKSYTWIFREGTCNNVDITYKLSLGKQWVDFWAVQDKHTKHLL